MVPGWLSPLSVGVLISAPLDFTIQVTGHNFRVMRSSPTNGLHAQQGVCLGFSPSPPHPPTHALLIKEGREEEREKEGRKEGIS